MPRLVQTYHAALFLSVIYPTVCGIWGVKAMPETGIGADGKGLEAKGVGTSLFFFWYKRHKGWGWIKKAEDGSFLMYTGMESCMGTLTVDDGSWEMESLSPDGIMEADKPCVEDSV